MIYIAYIPKGTKCEYDGFNFDSIPERNYYIKIKLMKENNEIQDFEMQVPYPIQAEFKDFRGGKVQSITYIADYVITLNNDEVVVIDTKGSKATTEESARLKQKIFMYNNRELPIYFIAPLPIYLGNVWVDVTKGYDFGSKLKTRYIKMYGKWKKNNTPNWKPADWTEHFEFDDHYGLFYIWKSTKKLSK